MSWQVQNKYLSTITNQPFLLAEVVEVAEMLEQGLSWPEIKTAVCEDNRLQIRSAATRRNIYLGLYARLHQLPPVLLPLLTDRTHEIARLCNFYLCLRVFRLLREIMAELIWDRCSRKIHELTEFEVAQFFSRKQEQEPSLNRWSEITWQKVQSNTLHLLTDAALLQGKGPWTILKPVLPVELRETLTHLGEAAFLKLMLESER